jgi:hypothetical protein
LAHCLGQIVAVPIRVELFQTEIDAALRELMALKEVIPDLGVLSETDLLHCDNQCASGHDSILFFGLDKTDTFSK